MYKHQSGLSAQVGCDEYKKLHKHRRISLNIPRIVFLLIASMLTRSRRDMLDGCKVTELENNETSLRDLTEPPTRCRACGRLSYLEKDLLTIR